MGRQAVRADMGTRVIPRHNVRPDSNTALFRDACQTVVVWVPRDCRNGGWGAALIQGFALADIPENQYAVCTGTDQIQPCRQSVLCC